MIGDYVLHFPLTDFAVSLLALAALIDVARLVLRRASWATTVDVLLVTGFLGALAAVGSGLWLVAAHAHVHDDLLSIHHWFAYGTLATASVSVIARLLQKRSAVFGPIKTATLVLSALLVSGAGFYGGKMAHPADDIGGHEAPHDETMPAEHGAMPPRDAAVAEPAASADAMPGAMRPDAANPADDRKPHGHDTTPHQH